MHSLSRKASLRSKLFPCDSQVLSNPEKEQRYLADHKLVPALLVRQDANTIMDIQAGLEPYKTASSPLLKGSAVDARCKNRSGQSQMSLIRQ